MGGHDDLDFAEYDPTPYDGGYDQALTYGEPLPPSRKTCYPLSDDGNDDPPSSSSANSPYDLYGSSDPQYGNGWTQPPYDFYPGYGNWFDNLPTSGHGRSWSDYHGQNQDEEGGFDFGLGGYGYGTAKPEEPAYENFYPGYGYGHGNEQHAHDYGISMPETPQPAGYDFDYQPNQIPNPYADCFSDWLHPPSPEAGKADYAGIFADERMGCTGSPWKGAEEYLFGRYWDNCGETRDGMPSYENHNHAHANAYVKSGYKQHIDHGELCWFDKPSYHQHHYQQEVFSRPQYGDDFYEEKQGHPHHEFYKYSNYND